MDADSIITKRLHVSGLTPAITPDDLRRRLSTFGTVQNLDGLRKLDALGQPKKFGYVTIEGTKAQLARCVNVLSGSTWKGTKLRIGDAKPDYKERIAKELASDLEPPRKKRKRAGGVEAPDMSLVTSSNVAERSGWKVTTMGRMVRPVRMRPAHPLPPPAESALRRNVKKSGKEGTQWKGKEKEKEGEDAKVKKKRRKDPDVRARRRTIDPLRWDSVQLKGMFLDVITAPREGAKDKETALKEPTEASGEDSSSSDSQESEAEEPQPIVALTPAPTKTFDLTSPKLPVTEDASLAIPKRSVSPTKLSTQTQQAPPASTETPTPTDLIAEKQSSLTLLHSLFSGADDWGGRESVGSDIDEDEVERLKREGLAIGVGEARTDEVEEVPMREAQEKGSSGSSDEMEVEDMVETETDIVKPVQEVAKPDAQKTKLKDLFAPREEEGFSLLGHLDLDLELDDDMDIPSFTQSQPEAIAEPTPAAFSVPAPASTSAAAPRGAQFTYDPSLPMFFPLASTFANPLSLAQPQNQGIYNTRMRDSFVGILPEAAAFHRTETEEQIRAHWEETKGELTKEWKRRFREAGKSRRRRGGGDGE
ncbi:hypothetical protein HWV62_524 [Athelia sp. TMB]|nr:hypothetical protein HWV62_524 [Athelia sp. TMB]